MSNDFWNGETYAIVKAMKASGNQPGLIQQWKTQMEDWAFARPVNDPDAQAVRAWLPAWQVRPFYTAEELAPMWPALAIAIGHTAHWPAVLKSARRLKHELEYAGLPSFYDLREALKGVHSPTEYFIVERLHYWRLASQQEIEEKLNAHG
jgi:hypothetical protein